MGEGGEDFLSGQVLTNFDLLSINKHRDVYLDELEWRFNNRENPYLFRDTLLKLISSENLPYQDLVGQS